MESPLPIRTIRDRTDDPAVPLFSPSTDAGSVPTDSAPSPNDPDPAIGAAAQLRFQKARIKAQALQLTDAMAMKIDAEKTAANATKKLKVTAEEKIRSVKRDKDEKGQGRDRIQACAYASDISDLSDLSDLKCTSSQPCYFALFSLLYPLRSHKCMHIA